MSATREPEALKACPFCGKLPHFLDDDSYGEEHVGCNPCDIGFHGNKGSGTAFAAWNRRHAPQPAPDARQLAAEVRALVDRQATYEGLWCIAETAMEGYLQQELRKLHAAVEACPAQPPAGGEAAEAVAREIERTGSVSDNDDYIMHMRSLAARVRALAAPSAQGEAGLLRALCGEAADELQDYATQFPWNDHHVSTCYGIKHAPTGDCQDFDHADLIARLRAAARGGGT